MSIMEFAALSHDDEMARPQSEKDAAADQSLANSFERIDINKAALKPDASQYDFHLLTLEYPACNLLPPDRLPNLAPPQNVGRRDAPPVDNNAIGISNTTFFVPIPTKPAPRSPILAPYNHLSLLGAVEGLSRCTGASKLELVLYYDGELCENVYRVKLSTDHRYVSGVEESCFDLPYEQWISLLGFAEYYEWIRTLQDLVTRSSYRAVYHVRERLTEYYGEKLAASEEHAWPVAWATSLVSPAENAEDAAADRAMTSARAYANAIHSWSSLDGDLTDGSKKVKVHAMTLFRALHAAVQTLSPPDLISPRSLCHAASQHTKLMLEGSESLFYGTDYVHKLTTEQLLTNLLEEATGTKLDTDTKLTLSDIATPPGWERFLHTWLTRVVRFVAERHCDDRSPEHAGLHLHGNEPWYNSETWETEAAAMTAQLSADADDDKEGSYEPPATVEDIESMMHDTELNEEYADGDL